MFRGLAGGELRLDRNVAGLFAVLAIGVRDAASHSCDHFQRLERTGGKAWADSSSWRGANERLAPTLMSVLAIAVGLSRSSSWGIAGLEVVRPMAVVVLGGLVTSTLVACSSFPMLYLRSGPSPQARLSRPF